ncbi:glycosyltransferase family A protein [Microbulbifer bruguierae]|uniref:Glycosyltransferase family A protein n=1 Tax=Microbulbifer bruguierae TaxID=3029061 RepID=A0ABY8N8M2_9GAMM|nr:glycosyltransferase family A protein [Microbulbifer bruguierae]WGL15256.1 glycosyltransferase family A protein [Microbulbifer bruguierae]
MSINEAQKKFGSVPEIGFVVIGRNEGERLHRCLNSILEQCVALQRSRGIVEHQEIKRKTKSLPMPIIYVDSGSTDGSVEYALTLGCETVQLDSTVPFTAARARNTGFKRLILKNPNVEWVHFVDGDCALQPAWLSKAAAFLSINPRAAIVCGRRREVYPQKTIYNALCDMEWDTPIGESNACGGDFLARRTALESVNAFNPTMIAGEEPEMCFRLRKENWSIWRIDEEMTSHDAAITSFIQFWLRNRRAGYAYAERCSIHATAKQPYCVRELISILFWALVIPTVALLFTAVIPLISVLLIFFYPALMLRLFFRRLKLRNSIRRSLIYAVLIPVGKFPQFIGAANYVFARLNGKKQPIIEYK